MRALMVTALRSAGHFVESAREGAEAIQRHRAEPAELIITDIFMPGMEGLETIRAIRRTDKDVKILAISGVVDMGNPLGIATRLGANRILEKPFHTHELIAAVKEVLLLKHSCPTRQGGAGVSKIY